MADRPRGRPKGAPPADVRRAQLLEAAINRIRVDGSGASMDELAAAGGVTKPVLYSHFGDRAGLNAAIAETMGRRLAEEIVTAFEPERSTREQVDSAVAIFVRWVAGEPELFRYLINAEGDGDGRPNALRIVDAIAEVVTPAVAEQYRSQGWDVARAELYAHGMIGFAYLGVEYWVTRGGAEGDWIDEAALRCAIAEFLWAGLNKDPGP